MKMKSTYTADEILSFLSENDKINTDAICAEMDKKEKKEILKKHPYDIWKNQKDGRWYTHLKDENKGRVLRSRKTRRELEDLLIDHYEETICKPCFPEVFEEWIGEKQEFAEIGESSVIRYQNDFKRFFSPDEPFTKIRMCDMTDSSLERFIKRTISEKKLTQKSYAGLRTLLIGVFKFAKREGYTDFSISIFFSDLALPKNIFSHKSKNPDEEVFSIDEMNKLTSYLWEKKNKTKRDLALLLQIFTGMRVGELTALKPCDNEDKYHLKICRTEYNCYDKQLKKRVTTVKDHTKTENGIRTIVLPERAQHVLNLLKLQVGSDEYLISEKGKRITSKMINYHLRKICKEIGIPPRSTHKIRRSYGSKLLLEQLDEKFVQNQMGHKDIATTKQYYYYDIQKDSSKLEEINHAVDFGV